jgi:hydroxypyruvate isomerase
MKIKDVWISEQLAWQLVQFLHRYRVDVRQLQELQANEGALGSYLEAMVEGDCKDAERLERALKEALAAQERSV